MTEQVYLDGAFRAHDHVVQRELERRLDSNGRFETLLVRDGCAIDIPAHLDRLGESGDLPASRAEVRAAVERLAADWRGTGRLRIVQTDPPVAGIAITVAPYVPPDAGVYAVGVEVELLGEPLIESDDPTRRHKSLDWRRAAGRLAHDDVFEGLLRNERGALVEGLRSNVLVLDPEPLTPALGEGCLPGTVRRRLLEAGLVAEGRIEAATLRGKELLLTNSLVGVIPVASVDGVPAPVGPRGREIGEAWRHLCAEY